MQYLIKWRELNYDQSTWEDEEMESQIPDFKIFSETYWDLRTQAEASVADRGRKKKKEKDDGKQTKRWQFPDKPVCDPRKQFNTQPEYITATRGTLYPYQLESQSCISQYRWVF